MSADGIKDLLDLAADLTDAGPVAMDKAHRVVQRGALNIKNDWRDGVSGLAHARALPSAITYDSFRSRFTSEAEIGPDKDRPQGALGNLIEFGSVNNPPHGDGQRALDREEPRFIAALEQIVGDVL